MRDIEIAWLAGLYEGEGSASIAKNGGTRVTIRMTDRDVIDRIDALFPCVRIQIVHPKRVRPEYNEPKTQYAWRISNPAKVREFLELVMPWLGERRTEQARQVLDHLTSRPGVGGFHRSRTHCRQGHEYTPENTLWRGPERKYRKCRTCQREWEAAYRTKNQKPAGATNPVPFTADVADA